MDINALLDKSFDELTPEEWEAIRQSGEVEALDLDAQAQRHADLEARLAQSVSDWARFNQVISDILRS